MSYKLPPATCLFLTVPKSSLAKFLEEARYLIMFRPDILKAIDQDLDQHALTKKESRLKDRQWIYENQATLPGLTIDIRKRLSKPSLQPGRPRMRAESTFFFWMLCVYGGGGVKSRRTRDLILESKSVELFLQEQNINAYGLSTIHENTNAISQATREMVMDAQIELAKQDNLDDFKKCQVDSTVVTANTSWPTDSSIMFKLIRRLNLRCRKLKKQGMLSIDLPEMADVIKELKSLDFRISNTPKNKPEVRNQLYRSFIDEIEVASQDVALKILELHDALGHTNLRPSKKNRLQSQFDNICKDLDDLNLAIEHNIMRIEDGKTAPVTERVLSVSDPDAAYIQKGSREAKIGYKPQLCRSEKGLVTAFLLPIGNAGDAPLLQELCSQSFKRTKMVPAEFSADGGYASRKNRQWLLDKGVEKPSFSSSKGKQITDEKEWNSPEYLKLRNWRSAVEALMSQLKDLVGFGSLLRRGIECVRAELTGKIIAFNFLKMMSLR